MDIKFVKRSVVKSSKKRFDLNIPGVSINTICVFCFKKIPLIVKIFHSYKYFLLLYLKN